MLKDPRFLEQMRQW